MSIADWIQFSLFFIILIVSAKPLGHYFEKAFEGRPHFLKRMLGGAEEFVYRILRVDSSESHHWTIYARDMLVFSAINTLITYALLRAQGHLPFNPQKFPGLPSDLAFNAAISFNSTTDWQPYSGESTMSYLSQVAALGFQCFIGASVGIAASIAMIRGLVSKTGKGIGNFWVDIVRCNLYILLPLSLVVAVILLSQGAIQNFASYHSVETLESARQVLPQGPAASQGAIKVLGGNGGGLFNANVVHPYENPTPLANFVLMLAMLLIPSGLVHFLGAQSGDRKHAWAIWGTMGILLVVGAWCTIYFESRGLPIYEQIGLSSHRNMEGKEARFGIFGSALMSEMNSASSAGAMNTLDSLTPMGGFVALLNIALGEIIFGGAGSGLYGMLTFVLLTVFIAGLLVGRTPEYLGKKLEGREIKFVTLAIIAPAFTILVLSGWAVVDPRGLSAIGSSGPHGFTEIFYAFVSATGNNGSSFGGLSANKPFYNILLGLAMFVGRFFTVIPMLAIAGSMSQKKIHPASESTFPTHGPLFVALLIACIILVGALTFFPAFTIGPFAEQLGV